MKKRIAIFLTAFISIAILVVVIVVLVAVFSDEGAFTPKDTFTAETQTELTEDAYLAQIEAAENLLRETRNPRYQIACTVTKSGESAPAYRTALAADGATYRSESDGAIVYFSNENSGIYRYLPDAEGPYHADGQTYRRDEEPIDEAFFASEITLSGLFVHLLALLKTAYPALEFTDGMHRMSEDGLTQLTELLGILPPGLTTAHTPDAFEVEFNRGRFYCYRYTLTLDGQTGGMEAGTYTVAFSFTSLNNKLPLPSQPAPSCSTADCSTDWSDFWGVFG